MPDPEFRYCTSADGARIAYATIGEGPAFLYVEGWSSNFELLWQDPAHRAWVERLAEGRQFIAFDRRGTGASQREVTDLSLDVHVADVAAVVDALRLDRFDMMGNVDGAAVAVGYTVQSPDRVSKLILWGPYANGRETLRAEAVQGLVELIRGNWGMARRAMAGVLFPSGPAERQQWFADLLRQAVSSDMAARYLQFYMNVDVTALLPRVKAPTLVLHRRGDRNVPSRAGRDVAVLIPDARFVALEGDSARHAEGDQSWVETVARFLEQGRPQPLASGAAGGVVTLLFTDLASSTALTQRLGDAKAQELVRAHNAIVREALSSHGGTEIKHTGDGIMASLPTASGALECAVAIQRAVARHADGDLQVHIGLNAGEPMTEESDLFGTSVQLARRICDHAGAGQILVSNVVRELSAGKGFHFADIGEVVPKGFEDPVRLYEVRWQE